MIGRNEAIFGCVLVRWGIQLAALSKYHLLVIVIIIIIVVIITC